MNIWDLPTSSLMLQGTTLEQLAAGLDIILEDTNVPAFLGLEAVHGAKMSIRVLTTAPPVDSAVSIRMSAADVASEWMRLSRTEARFDGGPGSDSIKGWMLRKTLINGKPAAIIAAMWIG